MGAEVISLTGEENREAAEETVGSWLGNDAFQDP